MTLNQIIAVIVGPKGATRSGVVCKVNEDGTVNVKVSTHGKPEMDKGIDAALVKAHERRVDSLFIVGARVGTKIGDIVAPE